MSTSDPNQVTVEGRAYNGLFWILLSIIVLLGAIVLDQYLARLLVGLVALFCALVAGHSVGFARLEYYKVTGKDIDE